MTITNIREALRSVVVSALAIGLTASVAAAESTLKIAMTSDDVPRTSGMPSHGFEGMRFLGYTAFEPLVNWDLSRSDVPPTLRPSLATKWTIDEADNTRWVFELRRGVKFHDGSSFDADSVIFNLERFYDDKSPQYDPVGGGLTRARNPLIDRWERIDDFTIAIYTKEPASYFPYVITLLLISSPAQWEKTGKNWAEFAKAPSGTGPFKITKVVLRERVEMLRNAAYWDEKRVPKVDRLVLYPMPEPTTRMAALRSGQVNWIELPPPDAIPNLKGVGYQIVSNIYPHVWPWMFSLLPDSPFRDKKVRQAANYCIDREGIKQLLNGMAAPAYGFLAKSDPLFAKPKHNYTHDPEKGRSLMKEAGYGPDKHLQGEVMITTGGSGQMLPLPMNEYIQQTLRECWIDVEYQAVESGTALVALRNAPNSPEARNVKALQWSTATSDVSWFFKHFHSSSFSPTSYNWGHWKNEEFDRLLDEIKVTFDESVVAERIKRAHEILVDEAPWLWVVHDVAPRALAPGVKGFVPARSWFQDLTSVRVE